MDNITHSLFGWTLARTGLGRSTPYATATLVIASNAPDLDIVTALTGGGLEYLSAHRGPTHGPLGFAGLGVLTGVGMLLWAQWRARRRHQRLHRPLALLARLCLLGITGISMHALMDLPTSYGTRLLSPFVSTWYAFDWMPIIDIYLWAILGGGLLAARLRPAAEMRLAAIALSLMAGDYATRALLHQRALGHAAAFTAAGVPSACVSHPTLVRHPADLHASGALADTCLQAAALPTFVSPFAFRVIRQYPDGYEISERDALHEAPAPAFWVPSERGPAITRASETRTGRVFLDFSRFPAAKVLQEPSGDLVVQFWDLRFLGTPFRLDPQPQARAPSAMTVRLDGAGRVVGEYLGN